jgi:hypothetical protein
MRGWGVRSPRVSQYERDSVAAPAPAVATTSARWPVLGEAVRTVDRLVAARLKRHLGIVAARGARDGEHLTVSAATTVATATSTTVPTAARTVATATAAVATTARATASTTACRTTVTASGRLVREATARKELLLAHREDERLTAIAAVQHLVGVTHADTSR